MEILAGSEGGLLRGCFGRVFVLLAIFLALGAGFHWLLRYVVPNPKPHEKRHLTLLAWSVPVLLGGFLLWSVLTRPGFITLSIGFGELEHRYCLRGLARTDVFPLGAVRAATARVEQRPQRTGPPRITTFVDIAIEGTWVREIPTRSAEESEALARRLMEESAAWR